jgi:hypothetical protein
VKYVTTQHHSGDLSDLRSSPTLTEVGLIVFMEAKTMKNLVTLLVALLLVTACTTTQPAPTSTPLPPTEPPPTEPPPPTDTPIPPTNTEVPPSLMPNPFVEEVLFAYVAVINEKDWEKAKTFLSEDHSLPSYIGDGGGGEPYSLLTWIQFPENAHNLYEVSDFVVNGNEVEFKWWKISEDGKEPCKGVVTMEEDKIAFLQISLCD